tara:strand:- start:2843 stop:3127 length:285 start_codon:yes stop_codon:yes gene_type:complete
MSNKLISIFVTLMTVSSVFAADGGDAKFGAAIGAGLIAIGASIGIGLLAFAGANATARQPEAANDIRTTINLPLFLLEGVAIIGLVVCFIAAMI